MQKIAHLPRALAPAPASSADSQSDKIAEAIKLLLNALSAREQQRVLDNVTKEIQRIPAPRAGETLGAVASLFQERDHWRVDEIKEQVAGRGVEASAKEIYNALGYLTRKGYIRRVGYGRYDVLGVGLVTSDDVGGEPGRTEDD